MNIAKRISLFLMIALLGIIANASYCYAVTNENQAESQTAEIQVTEAKTTENQQEIEVKLDATTAIKANLEDNVLVIENQSNKKIRGVRTVIDVGEERLRILYRKNIKGFETYSINLEDYFSNEFLEGKDIKIQIDDCMTYLGMAIYIIVSLAAVLLFLNFFDNDPVTIILVLMIVIVGVVFGF